MVVIVVLWEVIDPEAVPFIDPWREQAEKTLLPFPAFTRPFIPGPVTARVPASVQALSTERGGRLRRPRLVVGGRGAGMCEGNNRPVAKCPKADPII